ncbi:MAG: Serine/threonine-protein kinase tel1 [Caeruleum heppii]|nr:MAG: Serine/threonine-protein kinase tel1 [Caeruleum heppii]
MSSGVVNSTDRSRVTFLAQHARPTLVLDLFSVCAGKLPSTSRPPGPFLGHLAQAWIDHQDKCVLLRYLLLVESSHNDSDVVPLSLEQHEGRSNTGNAHEQVESLILNTLNVELGAAHERWVDHLATHASHINTDMVKALTSLCLIGQIFHSLCADAHVRRVQQLSRVTQDLLGDLVKIVRSTDSDQALVDAMLETLEPFCSSPETHDFQGLAGMANTLDVILENRRASLKDLGYSNSADPMDIDDHFDFSQGATVSQARSLDIPRQDSTARFSTTTFRQTTMAQLHLLGHRNSADAVTAEAGFLIDYLLSLQPSELLACRGFLPRAISQTTFTRPDAHRLLYHLGQEYLQSYEYDRCEVSLGICLEVMTALTDIWSQTVEDELSESSASMYHWFIDVALKRGIASPNGQIAIANLLHRLLQCRPDYAIDDESSSVRTNLLLVLRQGEISVKSHIADLLPAVFHLFVPNRHDSVFEDVLSSLPVDVDWIAGIAIRLLVLSRLASAFHTLLRRSVYHLFETAGVIPDLAIHASRCISDVTVALELGHTRNLLRLFLPQILHTWLETQALQAAPFSVFGYSSLKEMLQEIQQEAVAQLIMRAADDQIAALAATLDSTVEDVIEATFDRAIAYSIARDISLPPLEGAQPYVGGEMRMRKRFGKERFLALVNGQFARILAHLFRCIEQEDQIDRAFAKRPKFASAAARLRDIKALGSSDVSLPPNQQPSFRARYLLDEMDHLCQRTGHDPTRLWTPPLLTYVLRQLLDSMIPALGPLHACSVIRKLRLVVSLAGDVAAHDYPVEMLLHALRPYLTEPNCADDAMGLVQYLMQAGRIHLTGKPSFVAGLSLSVLASIRVFLSSSDAPQLLERQRRATKSRARQFHDWMTRFLDQYSSPQLSNDAAEVLNEIVHLASGISGRGNAKHGTSESGLLRALLREDDSAREILSGPSRSLALSLLCSQFEPPTRPGEDMYELDELAVAEGGSVWKSCQGRAVGKGYLLWIGRVLGRGYAASGIIPEDLLPEVQLHQSGQRPKTSSSSLLSDSNGVILSILRDTLLDESSATVSMAERTLQLVVSRLIDVDEMVQYETILPLSLLAAFRWQESAPPDLDLPYPTPKKLHVAASEWKGKSAHEWLRDVCIALARSASDEAVLGALPSILMGVSAMAQQLFPYVLHVVLLREYDSARTVRKEMSDILRHLFHSRDEATALHVKPMLLAILYLRSRPIPGEDTAADRESWLDLKYDEVADAAARCKMYKTALLFLEIHWSQTSFGSRRSSAMRTPEPTDLLLAIFRNIDDPDSFYGVQQPATLSSIVNRLDFEHDGLKSLAFCGARYDSQVLRNRTSSKGDTQGLISALGNLDLNGLSYTLLEGQRAFAVEGSPHNAYEIARKLEQWDLPVPAGHHSDEAVLYRAFQGINNTLDGQAAAAIIDGEVANTIGRMMDSSQTGSSIRSRLRTLAVLTEMTETLRSESPEGLRQTWQRMQQRRQWMDSGRFEDVSQILSARSTLFSSLQRREQLCTGMSSSPHAMRNFQIQALLDFSRMSRKHGYLQHSLTTATYLSDLIEPCQMEGLHVSAAVRFDVAQCLWDQGEVLASVQMLRDLSRSSELTNQAITVGKPELIARLGHHVAEARLEKPDEIISQYLLPAIKGLKGSAGGDEAGQVYHEFASFCDQQLQDTDNLEDYHRARRLRERKEAEVRELDRLCAAAGSQNKGPLQVHRNRAKSWFELDHREYQRLHDSRQAFIRQSLENYLLCLRACDSHENDALRFCALWLEQSGNDLANRAVSRYLSKVPSRKFAMLMNQLSSRLLDTRDEFQSLLRALVLRICVEHPYHSMYQIFLATKSRGKDETSMSRQSAASKVASQLRKQEAASRTWQAVHDSSICYAKFAMEKTDDKETYKPGARIPLKKMPAGHRLEQEVVANKLPPPTMTIPLRADCDYTGVPKTVRFHPEMTVAGGVSAPKIVTVIGSDGTKYKQLVKGGHDDLRQDAIMEQVFQQVSELLQHDRATRQRNLGIRTYRVLPLTTNTGVIEFVPNTIPLHDYLTPAHRAHYPNDWKPTVCRKNIGDVQSQAVEVRVKVFRQVTDHYHPVMRFFFMERFENPAEWFEKRLAYSRSTAAISILGHVLGLGDRHGHNILLDEKTGEVVHIDLGVAFDQGRVLPVPEVVPFRLTRDVVDGMGITKTEGVFRRCCEFTLEALRKEAYSIMTVLDVLRYDPLYSWTVSPLRAKRQLAQPEDEPGQPALEAEAAVTARKRESNEPSEADRALTVVTKKLSKTLSVTATVNELIQQATDERNLALLYGGWAAYS